jgi:IS4 transposase
MISMTTDMHMAQTVDVYRLNNVIELSFVRLLLRMLKQRKSYFRYFFLLQFGALLN